MSSWNRSIGHRFRAIYQSNPLLESNLIFLFSKDVNSAQGALERDWDALMARLETENDMIERALIKEELGRIEDQMDHFEPASTPPNPTLNPILLNGLKNNIDEIDFFLANEGDLIKRRKLEEGKAECLSALASRQAPVTNVTELNDAVDQIESDQRLLDSRNTNKLDEVDLQLLLNSGLLPFFDSRLKRAIDNAFEQMLVNDRVHSTIGSERKNLFEDADRKWSENKIDTEEAIQDLEKERGQINSEIANASASKRVRLRRRLKEIEDTISKYQEQIKKGYSDWTHRQRIIDEAEVASKSVLDSVPSETLDKLTELVTEAQGIRMERVQDYLTKEFTDLENEIRGHRTRGIFSEETLDTLEAKMAKARGIIVDQKQTDPKVLRKLANNFQSAKVYLSTSKKEVSDAKENRPQLEAQIVADYTRFKSAVKNISPGQIDELRQKVIAQMKEDDIPKGSTIFKKSMLALDVLDGKNVTMKITGEDGKEQEVQMDTVTAEFESRLQDISKMSAEELLMLSQDLNTLKSRMEFLENLDANLAEALSPENQDAKLAHKTIKELERAQNPDDIRAILEANLGAEHLELISHAEFEKVHRPFTKTGHMVFHEQGNKWKIIIDESVFGDAHNLDVLKRQLTHELLHLEFEKSDRVKAQVRQAIVEADPKKWQEIREAFIKMAKEKKKKPPNGDEWGDDDILSELYAMQNEMGRTWSGGKSSTDELNNLLTGMGVAAAIGEITEKTRGYEKANEEDEKTRGYEAGVEAGEDNRDPSKSVTDVATVSKEHAVYEDNKAKIDELTKRMKELGKSEYLSMVPGANELLKAMDGYNNDTDDLNEDLRKEPDSEVFAAAISGRIDQVTEDLNDLEEQVGRGARNAPNTEISLVRKLWINTTFLSMQDFVQLGINTYEFIQRTHKRKTEDHAARLGMALFSGTDLGRESHAKQQKAEAEEVNEWKSRYETLDAWELMIELKGIANSHLPNQDQVKAILRILASKGRLDWRSEDLWTVLNKLQSSVVLKPGDKLLLHNPILLRQRLHAALGEIYDYDEFTTLERDNEGAYQSGKGKYDTVHSRMQDQLNGRLDELLAQHRAGEHVEPMLYESIMEYAIKNGKCFAENVMFHLIAGMAEGLLPPDRGLALGDHLNAWPAIDWFTTHRPPMSTADWERLALQKFKKSFLKGSITATGFGDDFQNWYWTEVQNCPKVIERVKKSVGERSWDHDWGRSIAPLGDSRTAKQFLSGRSGQQETKITGVGNAYTGAVQWLEENSKNPKFASREEFARMAGWIAMTEGILDGTAYKEKANDNNTRADASMDNSIPRESGVGRHKGKSVRFHRDIVSAFVMRLDSQFFSMIKGREAKTDEIKKDLGTNARDYLMRKYPAIAADLADVEDIDSIYSRIDLIIGAMFDQISEARFQEILLETAPKS